MYIDYTSIKKINNLGKKSYSTNCSSFRISNVKSPKTGFKKCKKYGYKFSSLTTLNDRPATLIFIVMSKKSTLSLIFLFISQINFLSKDMTHLLFVLKYIVTLVATKLYALYSCIDEKNLTKDAKKMKRPDNSDFNV